MSGNTHHIYGPSTLERRMLCPGSKRMELPLWDLPEAESEDAAEGRLLHEAVAGRLEDESVLNLEQRIQVDKCRELLKVETGEDASRMRCEETLSIDLFSGTPDVEIGRGGDVAAVIEWKFGRIPVSPAKDNIQLASQALLVHEAGRYRSVRVRVFQPRCGIDSEYVYSGEDFKNIRAHIEGIIAKCEATAAPLVPDIERQCKYCKAKSICPALVSEAAQMVKVDASTLPAPKEWSDWQLSDWLTKFKILETLTKGIKDELKGRLKAGREIEGWTLKKGATNRSIEDIAKAFGLASAQGVDEKTFLGGCKISVPQLEEMLAKSIVSKAESEGRKLTLKSAKAEARELMKPLITTKQNEPSLERTA